jgi:hypothetical protein
MGKALRKTGDRTPLTVTNIAVKILLIYSLIHGVFKTNVISEQTASKRMIIN